jgi:hypothetical protein
MKRAVSFSLLFSSLLLIAGILPGKAQNNQSEDRYGTVEGIVVTSEGTPVADATVYVFRVGRSILASTDTDGKFTLTNLPAGNHKILAYKESDGFPNVFWSFYSEIYPNTGFPVINVQENQTIRDVTVRLGPKASRLSINVIDAKTKLPIRDASVSLSHKGKPKTLLRSGTNKPEGGFELLVPPSIPINVVVEAPGYKTWSYSNKGNVDRDAIRIPVGNSKKITVELEQAIR